MEIRYLRSGVYLGVEIKVNSLKTEVETWIVFTNRCVISFLKAPRQLTRRGETRRDEERRGETRRGEERRGEVR